MHLALHFAVAAGQYIALWRARQHERATARALADLDEPLLRDLGIDRSDIHSIAAATAGRGDFTRVITTRSMRRQAAMR